jgi:hypothetical protein
MGRPLAGLDEYLDWQERLESQKASGLSIDLYCLREGMSKTTIYRWVNQLQNGIPEALLAEEAARNKAESGDALFAVRHGSSYRCSTGRLPSNRANSRLPGRRTG